MLQIFNKNVLMPVFLLSSFWNKLHLMRDTAKLPDQILSILLQKYDLGFKHLVPNVAVLNLPLK